jgi:hypothetical protein
VAASPEAAGGPRRRARGGPSRRNPADRLHRAVLPALPALRRAVEAATSARRSALVAVFAVAAAVRLAPLLRTGSLTGALGSDDGAGYSLAAHLIRGLLPYRDATFDQAPGIAVMLAPFAALATWAGDPVGIATARLGVVGVGALNAVLVALFLRRYAPAYAVVGGLAYAVWRLPAMAEREVHPEAFAACGLLVMLVLLDTGAERRLRRAAASGAALGVGAAVTLWLWPAVAVASVYVAVTRGARTALAWTGGLFVGFATVAGPWILASPAGFWRQAVHDQLFPGAMTTTTEQFRRFADLARLGSYGLPATIEVMIATCVVVAVATASSSAWWQPEARLAALLTPVLCFVVAAAPLYRFGQFTIAPTLIIVLATSLHRLVPRPWRLRIAPWLAAAVAWAMVGLALAAVHDVVPRSSDLDRLRAFAAGPHPRCVWFETASEAVAANALTPQLERGCPVPVDRLAVFRAQNPTPRLRDALHEARHSTTFQLVLVTELRAADAAVIPTDDDEGILGDDTREAIPRTFRRVRAYETVSFWIRAR